MVHIRKLVSFLKGGQEEKPSQPFLHNGGLLLEKLIAASNGKYDIPIRSFSAEELEWATNNFVDNFQTRRMSNMCRGFWQGRPILVKKLFGSSSLPSEEAGDILSGVINDIATTAQMSHHKNVLKLVGCCLEFKHPALVYEYSGDEHILGLLLNGNSNRSLTWKSRLKIAGDIANVVLYLHTAFRTPIIYRMFEPQNIIVDKYDVAKLFNFSFCISLPPGELQIQTDVIGVSGFIDCEYYTSGFVSQGTDVYSFGVLLLVLLTGREAVCSDREGSPIHLVHYVKDCIGRNQLNHIVDPKIAEGREIVSNAQQLHAFLDLAFSLLSISNVVLDGRIKRGWGAICSRMVETGPYLPSCRDTGEKQLVIPDGE